MEYWIEAVVERNEVVVGVVGRCHDDTMCQQCYPDRKWSRLHVASEVDRCRR